MIIIHTCCVKNFKQLNHELRFANNLEIDEDVTHSKNVIAEQVDVNYL